MSDSGAVRYRVNEPSVIHQAIDGELVIIHLDNGVYYSLDRTGTRIWELLAAGQTVDAIAESYAAVDAPGADAIAPSVNALVERLRAEQLLVVDDDGHGADAAPAPEQTVPFSAPALQRYDDLQDLLLLDPIHAVDESGWPDRRDGG